MPQILIVYISLYTAGLPTCFNTCAAFYRSLTRREWLDVVLCLGIGGSHCRSPPQEAFNEIFMCGVCVYVCYRVGCKRGCVCVHLASCIIKAQKLAHREGREVLEGGGGGGEGASIGQRGKGEGNNFFASNIRGGMPHFYRGGISRRYRGSEEQSSQDGEGKRMSWLLLTARI